MSTTPQAIGVARSGRRVVYRVQDAEGRGPWRPGLSGKWVESRPDHENLQPWFVEFNPHTIGLRAGENYGCGCATLEQLRRWFSLSEYITLRLLGFQAVGMDVDMRKQTVRAGRRKTLYRMLAKKNDGTVPCFVCGRHVKEKNATLEHIVPRSMGGTDEMSNLSISHMQCNARRGRGEVPLNLPTEAAI